jgi:hypothetical protein
VYRLLSFSRALQGVFPELPSAASFPQNSEVDREILYAIMVAGGRNKLVPWAFRGFMPSSKCALSAILWFMSHSKNYSHRRTITKREKKNARSTAAMNMTQLPT